MAILLTEQEI